MVEQLRMRPAWAWWSEDSACVADRNSDLYAVGHTIDYVCKKKLKFFSCQSVPAECAADTWSQADYVLSVYWDELQVRHPDANPLLDCYYNGTAWLEAQAVMYEEQLDSNCIVTKNALSTPITDEGFAAVRRSGKLLDIALFTKRFITKKWNATVCNEDELLKMSKTPEQSLHDLQRDLANAWWICGGKTSRVCKANGHCPTPSRFPFIREPWFVFFATMVTLLVCMTCVLTCMYARDLPNEPADWAKRHLKSAQRMPGSKKRSASVSSVQEERGQERPVPMTAPQREYVQPQAYQNVPYQAATVRSPYFMSASPVQRPGAAAAYSQQVQRMMA